MNGIQYIKFLGNKLGEILLLKEIDVAVPFHAAQHTTSASYPGIQTGIQLRINSGALVFCQITHQIFVVVQ